MGTPTKKDLIHAFRKKNTKRRELLFRIYQPWFDEPYSGEVLAEKITQDLGVRVDRNMIYQIRCKLRRKGQSIQMSASPSSVDADTKPLSIYIPDIDGSRNKFDDILKFH